MWFTILLMESGKRKAELVLYGMVWYGTKARLTMKRKWETEIQRFRSEKKVHCTMYDAMQCNVHVPSDEHLNLLRRGRKAASNRARSYVGW